jgi:hypothetical protein
VDDVLMVKSFSPTVSSLLIAPHLCDQLSPDTPVLCSLVDGPDSLAKRAYYLQSQKRRTLSAGHELSNASAPAKQAFTRNKRKNTTIENRSIKQLKRPKENQQEQGKTKVTTGRKKQKTNYTECNAGSLFGRL